MYSNKNYQKSIDVADCDRKFKVSVWKCAAVGAGIGAFFGGVAGASVDALSGFNAIFVGIYAVAGTVGGAAIGFLARLIVACCMNASRTKPLKIKTKTKGNTINSNNISEKDVQKGLLENAFVDVK